MKNKLLGIWDVDPEYMERFAGYLNQKEKFPFSVLTVTSTQQLKAYADSGKIEILLINEGLMEPEISKLQVKKLIVLSERDLFEKTKEFAWIYKYQSLEIMIRQLMEYYYGEHEEQPILHGKGSAYTIGVFSPVNRCYKTSFALTLSQLCSKEETALYLNLEEYSGFSGLFKESYGGDLSDAFYYYRQNKQVTSKIHTLIYSLDSLDYIPPVRCPEDLEEFSAAETAEFIMELGKTGNYKTIIVDIGTGGRKAADILEVCDVIYMPVKGDAISVSKIADYEDYLSNTGRESILKKTRKLTLPEWNGYANQGSYMEQLLWSELGDYVRNLMKNPSVNNKETPSGYL